MIGIYYTFYPGNWKITPTTEHKSFIILKVLGSSPSGTTWEHHAERTFTCGEIVSLFSLSLSLHPYLTASKAKKERVSWEW